MTGHTWLDLILAAELGAVVVLMIVIHLVRRERRRPWWRS